MPTCQHLSKATTFSKHKDLNHDLSMLSNPLSPFKSSYFARTLTPHPGLNPGLEMVNKCSANELHSPVLTPSPPHPLFNYFETHPTCHPLASAFCLAGITGECHHTSPKHLLDLVCQKMYRLISMELPVPPISPFFF